MKQALLQIADGRSLCFPRIFIKKNKLCDRIMKLIIELGYRKISLFVSVSQINYYRQTDIQTYINNIN